MDDWRVMRNVGRCDKTSENAADPGRDSESTKITHSAWGKCKDQCTNPFPCENPSQTVIAQAWHSTLRTVLYDVIKWRHRQFTFTVF